MEVNPLALTRPLISCVLLLYGVIALFFIARSPALGRRYRWQGGNKVSPLVGWFALGWVAFACRESRLLSAEAAWALLWVSAALGIVALVFIYDAHFRGRP